MTIIPMFFRVGLAQTKPDQKQEGTYIFELKEFFSNWHSPNSAILIKNEILPMEIPPESSEDH